VPTWAKVLAESDFPHDYLITFAAIVSTLSFLIFPEKMALTLLIPLVTLLLPPDDAAYMNKVYLPGIRKATSTVKLP